MYIESKSGDGIVGSARIGRIKYSKSGKSIHYRDKTFQTLRGRGFKANYFDIETGEEYWISGCHKDGRDGLYGTFAEIDKDVQNEYWTNIRNMPENCHVSRIKVKSKY